MNQPGQDTADSGKYQQHDRRVVPDAIEKALKEAITGDQSEKEACQIPDLGAAP